MRFLKPGVLLLLLASVFALPSVGQSLIAGDIAGTVVDPSHAAVGDAAVTLKSLDTGSVVQGKTSSDGYFRFSLVKPGHYEITVAKGGFATVVRTAEVSVGKTSTVEIALEISTKSETIEVTSEPELISTETSVNTTFTQQQVANLPSPGGDITNLAFTSPGVVVATNQSGDNGYGNFTVNGLPATSNLFTVNGENDMDPYFNINNSGATNLTLGANEVQEATITTNPYSGQYGQLSGAQVSYITKSGTNAFHGNAQYWWNGRYMNANDFFNKWTTPAGTPNPAPFANANQWATSVGGPIIKDKTFFFVDYEGLKFILPSSRTVSIPSADFANAVLNNIQSGGPTASPDVANEYSTYQQIFNLYANAPGASSAHTVANTAACNNIVLAGFDPTTEFCRLQFLANPTAPASEWIVAARLDQKLGEKDNLFVRYKVDHGLQPTSVSTVSPNFNALSNQPSWDLQVNESHEFSPSKTNVFTAAGSHYVAQFAQNQQLAYDTLPYAIYSGGSPFIFSSMNPMYAFPQGRNITQYQFIDDFTWNRGKHSFKFGGSFNWAAPIVYYGYSPDALQQFADGLSWGYERANPVATDVPVAMWGLGLYAEDQIKLKSNFTLTLALRAERNSNPVCQKDCFANFKGPFNTLASYNAADPGSIPYSADINFNQHQAYQGVDSAVWSPRVAFSWAPGQTSHFPWLPGGGKTVISGGFGVFYDNPAAGLVDDLLGNPPVNTDFLVSPSPNGGVLPFTPNGAAATWQAAVNGFDINKSFNDISASMPEGVTFTPPSFTALVGTIHAPRVYEWNFQVQQEITKNTVLVVNYVGNSGSRLPYGNAWGNAYDGAGVFAPGSGLLPSSAPDPIYDTVNQVRSGAITNYNGMNVTVREQIKSWIVAHFNYTYGHNLDESSNGGIFAYGFASGQSIQTQLNPTSLRAGNYGNSDYDIRHLISGDWVMTPTFHFENKFAKLMLNGWQWSGKIYWHTGMPYSIEDGNISGNVGSGLGTAFLATVVPGNPVQTAGCGQTAIVTPCLNSSAFLDTSTNALTAWPNQTRNQFRAADYFDVDMGLFKNIQIKERVNLGIGMMAYNALNHPNMPFPNNTFTTGDPTFGTITGGPAVGVPTSPYGNFLGFDSSPRIVQLSAKITF